MITDRHIKYLRPTDKVQYLCDEGGLYLKVSAAGTKTWTWRSQEARNRRWIKIGRYPAMSLLEARQKTQELNSIGVKALRTVQSAYLEYLPQLRRHYASHGEIERRFWVDVLPFIGEKRIDEVTRQDLSDILHHIVQRGSPVAANRTFADVNHFMNYCVARGWISSNPLLGVTRRHIGGKEIPKDRNLSFDELELFIPALLEDRFALETRLALGLLLTTGQRSGEILGLHKREVDRTWWHIPPERTKNRKEQKVYLSPQARALLRIAFKHFGARPFSSDTRALAKALSRLEWPEPFTPHDIRRTVATRMADLGVLPHVIEKVLNHRAPGVVAVYNRAEYLPERKAAWRLWGRHLAALRRQNAKARLRDPDLAGTDRASSPIPG